MMMMTIPIEVTLEGIVTDVSDIHCWKAALPGDRVSLENKLKLGLNQHK